VGSEMCIRDSVYYGLILFKYFLMY